MIKVNNRDTVTISGMCSKLTIKRPEWRQRCFIVNFIANFTYSGVFIVNFEHISHPALREICRNASYIINVISGKILCAKSKLFV